MKKMLTKSVSILLSIVMIVSLFTIIPASAATEEDLIDSLAALYDGDEERAKSDLEAMKASGLIDEDGNMVELDVREDGVSVDLYELAQRITAGETIGKITVNGVDTSAEQITKLSQMKAALELAQLLDEEIEVTDEHVENLRSLLTGVADGSIDLDEAIRTGKLELA